MSEISEAMNEAVEKARESKLGVHSTATVHRLRRGAEEQPPANQSFVARHVVTVAEG